jgi:hypothetical protein
MRIINLSYLAIPELRGHEILHSDICKIKEAGWPKAITAFERWQPDLIIEREWNDGIARYEPLYQAMPHVKKAFWWIDAHVNHRALMTYAMNFNYIFLAISRFISATKADLGHNRVYWLPLCWSGGPIEINNGPKNLEVSFVCRWTPEHYFKKRLACIAKLRQHFGQRVLVVNSIEMINIVRRSKVSMNSCYDNDLNFRYFEVMGCGTELVTNPCEDLYKIDGMAQRVTVYHDLDEMIELTEAVLAGKGSHDVHEIQRWIESTHTLEHRYRAIIDTIFRGNNG